MRLRTILAAFALAFVAIAPPLAAQAVRLPDSLEWTGLPSAPADFPDEVKAGNHRLLRSIARDPDVYVEPGMFRNGFEVDLRRDAAQTMLEYRMNQGMSRSRGRKGRRGRPCRGYSRLRLATAKPMRTANDPAAVAFTAAFALFAPPLAAQAVRLSVI